ncbi:MAG: lamin tail domain-containing protein [Candidatus Sumerlaeia bacterium]|nr:lamin tail domain-containing protein [Candidatus Sumerlaeia bacterium]
MTLKAAAIRPLLTLVLVALTALAAAFDPVSGDFSRASSSDIRVMSWNVEKKFRPTGDVDELAAIERVLTAIQPDVIVFQEIVPSDTEADLKTLLETQTGGTWYVHRGISDGFNRNLVASRYPLSMQITDVIPSTGLRGVTAALVDLPDATYGSSDLYIMGLHLKSGGTTSDEEQRQAGADAIINWIRDIQTDGGNITLPHSTPIVWAGDFNIDFNDAGNEDPYHTSRTLVTGDIYDEATWGADFAPDWDGTAATDAAPYDHTSGWSRTQPATANPSSRLDRIYYTDSAMRVKSTFILNTTTMTSGALTAAGLQAGDTDRDVDGPDHLPLVADFALGRDPNPVAQLVINEFSYDDVGADDRTFVEFKNIGGRPLNLDAPVDYLFLRTGNSVATSEPGSHNIAGSWDLVGVIPPGGIFVLYDDGDQSAGIEATIEANLPAIQRMKNSTFTLNNGPNAGFALVTRERTGKSTTQDHLIEAYIHAYDGVATSHFIKTNSTSPLVIELTGNQLGGVLSNDNTISRRVGDRTLNDYSDWVIGDVATPGLVNNTASASPDAVPATEVALAAGEVLINEIDYDDPGADDESFIELFNVSGRTIVLSDIEVLATENGSIKRNYKLGYGTLADGARWVLGTGTDSASVAGSVDETMVFGGETIDFLENGANDGVALRLVASPSTLIDSVSYAGSGAHPTGAPASGNAGTDDSATSGMSLSRWPDGANTFDNAADFSWLAATPGTANPLVPVELDMFLVD